MLVPSVRTRCGAAAPHLLAACKRCSPGAPLLSRLPGQRITVGWGPMLWWAGCRVREVMEVFVVLRDPLAAHH